MFPRLKVKLLSFIAHISKFLWVLLNLEFFLPSLKIDSIIRTKNKRKYSHASNSILRVLSESYSSNSETTKPQSLSKESMCMCIHVYISHFTYWKIWGTVWKLNLIYLNPQVFHSASITLIKRKRMFKYVTLYNRMWQQRRKRCGLGNQVTIICRSGNMHF